MPLDSVAHLQKTNPEEWRRQFMAFIANCDPDTPVLSDEDMSCASIYFSQEPAVQSLDWLQCPAVESIPGKVSGAWVLKDTRMPVSVIFENIEAGLSVEEVMEQFDVTREEVSAILEFVTRSLDKPPSFE